MKYVKCINTIYRNFHYIRITSGKIYKCIAVYDDHITIINDIGDCIEYHKDVFIDVTRKLKLKRVLKNEI